MKINLNYLTELDFTHTISCNGLCFQVLVMEL